jgi:oligoribonuclease NrnB/cAMP/cGMP phosphodiesterase (DHH superfamily)
MIANFELVVPKALTIGEPLVKISYPDQRLQWLDAKVYKALPVQHQMMCNPSVVDLLLYHGGCPDGIFGAYACYLKHNANVTYVPLSYNHRENEESINKLIEFCSNKHVVMVDFSVSYETTMKLIEKCKSFIVLDHNTALKDLQNVPAQNKVFDMKRSGAVLSYNYFFPDTDVPVAFKYIEDRDIWRWAYKEQSEPFTTALHNKFCMKISTYEEHPQRFEELTNLIDTDEKINKLIDIGKAYLEYKQSLIKDISSKFQKIRIIKPATLKINSYIGALINSNVFGSEIGNTLSSLEGINFAIIYTHHYKDNTNHFYCSIRSNTDDCDVSEIAKLFGGGGHIRASGFNINCDFGDVFEFIKDN